MSGSSEGDGPTGTPSTPEDLRSRSTPRCLVVTGPARKETWAWIEARIRRIRETQPGARLAILAADADLGQLRAIARTYAPIEIRRLMVPCACCPALSELPSEAKQLVDEAKPDWLIIELPAPAVHALLAHFDAALHWPREFVVCLDARWSEMRRADELNWFQSQLLSAADCIAPADPAGAP